MPIRYTVRRGAAAGKVLTPHRHADGMYVASPDRFKNSYRRYPTAQEAVDVAIKNGWSVRMSDGRGPPSLITPANCE